MSIERRARMRELLATTRAEAERILRPPAVQQLAAPGHPMNRGDRTECFRLLAEIVGRSGLPSFLRAPQPALGERTGAVLLQGDPGALLERLRMLDELEPERDIAP